MPLQKDLEVTCPAWLASPNYRDRLIGVEVANALPPRVREQFLQQALGDERPEVRARARSYLDEEQDPPYALR